MKPKTLAVLAILVAGLAAFIAFYERDLPGSDEQRELGKRVFPKLAADDITGLQVEWNGKRVKLEREPAPAEVAGASAAAAPAERDWRIVAPLTARADKTMADRLAGDLAQLESERSLEGAKPADVGLATPRGKVTWTTGKAQGTLELGDEVPASSDIVVASAGAKEPRVVAKSIVADIDHQPGDWRSKQVLAEGRDKIDRIRIVPAGGAEETVLARKGERFEVERPYADAADPQEVDPLLSELTGLQVDHFLDAPLPPAAEKALAAPVGRIELSLAGKTAPFVVEVGPETEPGGDRYLRADSQTFEAKTRLADTVSRPPVDWRSKAWTSFDSWKVERIRVDDPSGKLDLTRSEGDWLRDGVKISYTDVGDLLYAITSARADEVLTGNDAAAHPASSPVLTVVFSDAQGGEETLTLGKPDGDHTPARVSGRDVVLMLPNKAADDVLAKVKAVRESKPVEPPKSETTTTGKGQEKKSSSGTPQPR